MGADGGRPSEDATDGTRPVGGDEDGWLGEGWCREREQTMPRAGGKSTALTAKKAKAKGKVVTDEDIEFKKKQKEQQKKEAELRAKLAGGKGGKKK
ncbi:Hypothetical Protein FCC1311_063672 [Hondaea fermentalgiana]|uniref:Translation machinery-associated protein 7 n=1 Tax=Hondaea fermentalgiana TaxID=2315210 RepID=A0A2R5GGY2_9STRA|nr:Hypothetical Protein FCC1311_063672 [Hondaea fermentalgiana]|eukprot:GBG30147.1 Hypothetical Protein FCC1311_063672 [Hondaea fermentalgiana]